MQFSVGAATDIGRRRAQNQDSFVSAPELGLFVVADGMGGHRGGETASAMVVELVPDTLRKARQQTGWKPRQAITDAVRSANSAIFKRAAATPMLEGMGTTTTALLFEGPQLTIGHVGDSRCYFFRPGAAWQLTRDHSLVQERLRAGLITRDEARNDRMKNVITRSVGFEGALDVEIYEMETRSGDVFLICSDGLSGMVDDQQMLSVVESRVLQENNPQRAVEELIQAANNNGGEDNVTVILIKVL